MSKKKIRLGYPLDLLLDRKNKLSKYKDNPEQIDGGFIVPDGNYAGTGNVIIRGRPGTGKTILALQIAQRCCKENKKKNVFYVSAFVSLEEQLEHVLSKAESFNWEKDIKVLHNLHNLGEFDSSEKFGNELLRVLSQPEGCTITSGEWNDKKKVCSEHNLEDPKLKLEPKVILSALTPRSLSLSDDESHTVFTERYKQLENILKGAKSLRERKEPNSKKLGPDLRVVCIDSLNVFGNKLLTREEIYRLFDLFKRYQVIGVFVLEEDEKQILSPDDRLHGDMIEYMADAVISLEAKHVDGYFMRYFEIVKSRYQSQVYGKHPFKILGEANSDKNKSKETSSDEKQSEKTTADEKNEDEYAYRREGIVISPSLHYVVSSTGKKEDKKQNEKTNQAKQEENTNKTGEDDIGLFGNKNLNHILHPDVTNKHVIMVEGVRGTFKKTLARNYLFQGIADGENVLYLRLSDSLSFNPQRKFRLSKQTSEKINWNSFDDEYWWKKENETEFNSKFTKAVYTYKNVATLTEIAFKSGTLLPEEFIQEVLYTLYSAEKERKIKRVYFEEIGLIGVGYPFLQKSITAGDTFLSAFVHVIRSQEISLVMTGTTGQFKDADDAVSRGLALADTFLRCSYRDVFGNRYVIIEGEGLTNRIGERDEYTPAVIMPSSDPEKNTFKIDIKLLQGFVGFGTGTIYRPVLEFHAYEELGSHQRYSKELREKLELEIGRVQGSNFRGDIGQKSSERTEIETLPKNVSAMLESLNMFEGHPINQTIVSAIDEFYLPDDVSGKKPKNKDSSDSEEEYEVLAKLNFEQEKEDKHLETFSNGKPYAHPYYANMMVLAYRFKDDKGLKLDPTEKKKRRTQLKKYFSPPDKKQGYIRAKSWTEVFKLANFICNKLNEGEEKKYFLYDYYRYVDPSLSCMLMDALVSGFQKAVNRCLKKNKLVVSKKVQNYKSRGKIVSEIMSSNDIRKMPKSINEVLRNTEKEISDHEKKIKELKKTLPKLKRKLFESEEEQSELKQEQSESEKERSELEQNLLELKDGGSELEEERSELKRGMSELKQEELELKQELFESEAEQFELETKRSNLKTELPKLKTELPKLREELSELKKILTPLKKLKSGDFKILSKKQEEVKALIKLLAESESHRIQEDTKVNELLELMKKLSEMESDLNSSNVSVEDVLKEMQEDVRALIKLLAELEGHRIQEDTKVKELLELLELKKKLSKMDGDLDSSNVSVKDVLKEMQEDVKALIKLLAELESHRIQKNKKEGDDKANGDEDISKENGIHKRKLSPNASVYLCWYSQLRELIKENEHLTDKLRVCALPGGGFRGDWYVGVAKGSVSVGLGEQLIKTLNTKKEEYKRLHEGIGLPTREDIYTKNKNMNALAPLVWRQKTNVKLSELREIHRYSLTRAQIPEYREYWQVLSTFCQEAVKKILENDEGTLDAKADEYIKALKKHNIVDNQLYKIINTLVPCSKS